MATPNIVVAVVQKIISTILDFSTEYRLHKRIVNLVSNEHTLPPLDCFLFFTFLARFFFNSPYLRERRTLVITDLLYIMDYCNEVSVSALLESLKTLYSGLSNQH
eukprot:TRINITY_DN28557_c0_g2_i1.p1 TRINITY_DN28557_c0_g2~~TRINITY_DN28557_c0_g2_i1.p1  ORF type:complete len:105 (+),score=1.35 TRINITY_DN28557_c0_g2_i1:554-868(+)